VRGAIGQALKREAPTPGRWGSAWFLRQQLMIIWCFAWCKASTAQQIHRLFRTHWFARTSVDWTFRNKAWFPLGAIMMQSCDESCSRIIQRPFLRTTACCGGPVFHRRRTVPGIVCIQQHQHSHRPQWQNLARTINFPCHCLSGLWASIALKRNLSHKNIVVRFNQVRCGTEKRPWLWILDDFQLVACRGTDRPAVGAFLDFFVELECIQVRLNTQHRLARRTDKIWIRLHSFAALLLDDFLAISGHGPDSSAVTAFAYILGKSVGVQIDFNVTFTLTWWAVHKLLLLCGGRLRPPLS